MNENMQQKLLKQFIKISEQKWIKGINNTTNSVGLTFENLLHKKTDSMYFPDYQGIEIKCTQRFSRYPISLFSLSFDGPNLYEMNRLLKIYGKYDTKYNQKLQLQGSLFVNKYNQINNNFFKLKIDKVNQKIIVAIYNLNNQFLEEKTYIDFKTLKSRIELKLTNLAVIYASKKIIEDNLYFRYYLIKIYKLKSFETFIELLEKDYIKVSIIGRISRSGSEEGRQRNKNLVFSISKNQIELLFQKVIEYNSDLEKTN